MPKKSEKNDYLQDLRIRAEDKLNLAKQKLPQLTHHEIESVVHELHTYQIELEMQNEELRKSQQDLEESRSKYIDLYDFAPVGFLTVSEKDLVVDINLTACKLLGVERNKAINKGFSSFIVKEDQDIYYLQRKTLLELKTQKIFPLKMLGNGGEVFWAEVTALLQTGEGNDFSIRLTINDITERVSAEQTGKHAEEALRRSEEKFRTYIESSPVSVFVTDENGRYCDCNKAALELTGYTREELFNLSISDMAPQPTKEKTRGHFSTIKERGVLSSETRFLRKDGSIVPVIIEGVTLPDNKYMAFCNDITVRKRAEETIRLHSEIMMHMLEGVNLVGAKDGIIRFSNPEFERMFGYEKQELLGKHISIINAKAGKNSKDLVEQIILSCKKKRHWEGEIENVRKDGTTFWSFASISPFENSMFGKVFLSVQTDITERKIAEDFIRASEIKYRGLFNCIRDAILVTDNDRNIIDCNPAFLTLFKYPESSILGNKTLLLFKDEEEFVSHEICLKEYYKGDKSAPVLLNYRKKGGELFLGETSLIYLKGSEGNRIGFVSLIRDVTERVFAENEKTLLLESARQVLENKTFEETTRIIFDYCKKLTGAKSGYVALLSEDGSENKVLFLDAGGMPCSVDESLPMAIKGLIKIVYEKNKAVYENDFEHIDYKKLKPKGHVQLKNVLFVPLIVHCKAVGIIGLVNKKEDFTESDACLVSGFSEYISIALQNSKNITALVKSKIEAENYLQTAGVMMVGLDNEAKVTMINKKGCELLGYSQDYIIGKNWIENFIEEKDRKIAYRIFQHLMEGIYSKNRYVEGAIKCRYNKTKSIGWRHTAIRDLNGNITGTLSSGEDLTEMIKMSEEINKAQKELSSLSQHIEKVREDEKTHLSRAIHDELGQAITALKLDTNWLSSKIGDEEIKIQNKLSDMSSLLENTLDKVQKIAYELRPDFLDHLGLIPAIQYQSHALEEKTGIKFIVKYVRETLTIDKATSTALYRIFQESVTNIVRHSKASKASITIEEKAERIYMSIKDNGEGMKEENIYGSKSLGMIGMRERVKMLNGEINIESKQGRGINVKISIPVKGEKS